MKKRDAYANRVSKMIYGHSGGNDDPQSDITDTLADLMHLCDRCGLDFDDIAISAKAHYLAEYDEDEEEI